MMMEYFNKLHDRLGTTGLVVTSATILVLSALCTIHLNLSIRREGEPSVIWSWLPVLGGALELGSRPLEYLNECAKQGEGIFGMVIAGNRMFIITDPHSSGIVLRPTKALSWVEFHNTVLINFFGSKPIPGTLEHPHDDNLLRKWYLHYLMGDASLHDMTIRMQTQLLEDIQASSPTGTNTTSLYTFLSQLVFRASVASLYDSDAARDPELYDAFMAFDEHLPLAAAGYKVDYASKPRNAREILHKACRKYHNPQTSSEFMIKRHDYFETFDNGVNTDAFQLAMLWASVGNTMPATFWVVYHLLRDPTKLEKFLDEVRTCKEKLGETETFISQELLDSLVYVDACITETLRLCSGSLIMRMVQCPTEVTMDSGKTYKFRKGDRVGLCPPLWHHDGEIYPDPETFSPERWLVGDTPEEVARSAIGRVPLSKAGKVMDNGAGYNPFGGGAIHCPGRRFTRNEIKALAVYLLIRFKFAFSGGSQSSSSAAEVSDGQQSAVIPPMPPHPGFDGARAGLGIFPPKTDVPVTVSLV
mmetsp:Transcript_13490/g.22572  ORF Transcript_13490/g.22572 Transcript_13490/m.22572 type:complete len:530 (-) Transcript_13490:396-1985(-)